MNQFIAGNHYRRYPLAQDAVIPFSDEVLVELQLVLSTKFAIFDDPTLNYVALTNIARSAGTATLTFTITSAALAGYKLVGSVLESAADDTRILLALKTTGNVAHPELGYGIAIIGKPSDLTGLGSSTTLSAKALRSVIRLNTTNDALVVRVANTNRAGPSSSCDETAGTAEVLVLQGRTVDTVDDCVEVTLTPDELQRHMDPTVTSAATTEVAIVPPVSTHDRYPNGVVTTITTNLADIQDEIPTLPSLYDADVDTGPVAASAVVAAGHNAKLGGSVADNLIRFTYQLNAGDGIDCETVLGYPDLGRLAKDCVKSINGVHTIGGRLTIVAGDGVGLLPDQAGHRILVLVNAENLTRAQS